MIYTFQHNIIHIVLLFYNFFPMVLSSLLIKTIIYSKNINRSTFWLQSTVVHWHWDYHKSFHRPCRTNSPNLHFLIGLRIPLQFTSKVVVTDNKGGIERQWNPTPIIHPHSTPKTRTTQTQRDKTITRKSEVWNRNSNERQ